MSDLDKLYAKYGELCAKAERTSHNTRMAYNDKADGVLTAIRILEGATHLEADVAGPWVLVRLMVGRKVKVLIDRNRRVYARGILVQYSEYGEVGLRGEDGAMRWAWPALEVMLDEFDGNISRT